MDEHLIRDREALEAAIRGAGLNPTALSVQIGRSKDYIADYLRGTKRSLGHRDMEAIHTAIARARPEGRTDADTGTTTRRDMPHIHIGLTDFREEVISMLRSLRVPPVLARERTDALLEALRELAEAHDPKLSGQTLRIELGSPAQEVVDQADP